MNYKNHLIANHTNFSKIKDLLEKMDTNYFTTTKINERIIDGNTISIVMAACNRSVQTYFTLDTISKSFNKNVQVILVDDSTDDPIAVERLNEYDIHIELVNIKNKFWVNPCVNYNIGFKHIRGGKVIIQNAEVCHIGDVLNYVDKLVNDDEYHVFNVYALGDENANNMFYDIGDTSYSSYDKIVVLPNPMPWAGGWYQHYVQRNSWYHFLTAMTKTTFDKIGGFDIDYSMAVGWDDNDLVFKIVENHIKIITIKDQFMGVHQWHRTSPAGMYDRILNDHLFNRKCAYYIAYRSWLNLTAHSLESAIVIINLWF